MPPTRNSHRDRTRRWAPAFVILAGFFLLFGSSVEGAASVLVETQRLDHEPEQPVYNTTWRDETFPKMMRTAPRQFQRLFRLRPTGFLHILNAIRFDLNFDAVNRVIELSAEAQLGMFVCHVAHNASMEGVSALFGTAPTTCWRAIIRVRDAINHRLYNETVA